MNNINVLNNTTENFNLNDTQKKLDDLKISIENFSDAEKLQKKTEIQSSISTIKSELIQLKNDANVDASKIQEIEQQLSSLETDYNNFLNGIQAELSNLEQDVQNDNGEKKSNRWHRNKKTVLIGAGTLGVGLLIRRWWNKRKEKKSGSGSNSTDKKPWYKKWRGVGLIGVGGFFGFKSFVGEEKRNEWKEKLGLKKSNTNETTNSDNTTNTTNTNETTNTTNTDETNNSNETSESNNSVNEELTPEEKIKRDKYIEDSIKNATTIPVVIDYGQDKDVLEAKGCPKTIGFDVASQSILFGNNTKLKIKTEEFKKDGNTTVTSMNFDGISIVGGKIRFDYTATGKKSILVGSVSGSDTGNADISKEDFIKIIQPHYKENKNSYKVNMPTDEGFDVPVSITATVNRPQTRPSTESPETNTSNTEMDKEFLALSESKRNSYNIVGAGANVYMRKLNRTNPLYGSSSDVFGARASTENQLEKYTGTIPSIVDTKFNNVGDFIKDSALDGLNDKAAITSEKIADFLEKYKDNQYVGNMIGAISQGLKNIFNKRETVKKSEIDTVFEQDPHVKTQVTLMVWKMSVLKLYCQDMKKSLTDELKNKYPNWTEQQINQYVKENFLDQKLVSDNNGPSASKTIVDMGLGIELNSERKFDILVEEKVKELQNKIELTGGFSEDAVDRGEIKYNKQKKQLESRGIGTKINLLPNGKYKLSKGNLNLNIEFDSMDDLLWTANYLNKTDYKYKKGIMKNYWDKFKNRMWDAVPLGSFFKTNAPEFMYQSSYVANKHVYRKKGIVVKPDPWWRIGSVDLSLDALKKNSPTLTKGNNGKILVNHMNTRIRHYDADDTFWGKMKDTFGEIGDKLTKGRN